MKKQICRTRLPIDLALVNLSESTFSNEIDLVEVTCRGKQILEGEAVRVSVSYIRRNLPPRIDPYSEQKSGNIPNQKGKFQQRGRKSIKEPDVSSDGLQLALDGLRSSSPSSASGAKHPKQPIGAPAARYKEILLPQPHTHPAQERSRDHQRRRGRRTAGEDYHNDAAINARERTS
jgi:hypothetical protein